MLLYYCQIHSNIELFPEDFSDINVFLCFYDIKVSVRLHANIIIQVVCTMLYMPCGTYYDAYLGASGLLTFMQAT